MNFFEDLFVKTKRAFNVISNKTGEFIDISKLKIDIADLENKKKSEFEKLGKITYRSKERNSVDESGIEDCIEKINKYEKKIAQLRVQVRKIRKGKCCCSECYECRSDEEMVDYCPECGQELECEQGFECSDCSEDECSEENKDCSKDCNENESNGGV